MHDTADARPTPTPAELRAAATGRNIGDARGSARALRAVLRDHHREDGAGLNDESAESRASTVQSARRDRLRPSIVWHGRRLLRRGAAVPAVLRGDRLWRHAARSAARPRPGATAQTITVRFNADTNPACPGASRPASSEVPLPLGRGAGRLLHRAELAGTPVTGVALYNVTPEKAGKYFHKTACFCFNQQTLEPRSGDGVPAQLLGRSGDRRGPEHRATSAPSRCPTPSSARWTMRRRAGALAKAGPHVGPRAELTPRQVEPLSRRTSRALNRQRFGD